MFFFSFVFSQNCCLNLSIEVDYIFVSFGTCCSDSSTPLSFPPLSSPRISHLFFFYTTLVLDVVSYTCSYSGLQSGMDLESSGDMGRLRVQDVGEGNVKIRCISWIYIYKTILHFFNCSSCYWYCLWQFICRLYDGRIVQGPLRGTPVIFKVIILYHRQNLFQVTTAIFPVFVATLSVTMQFIFITILLHIWMLHL